MNSSKITIVSFSLLDQLSLWNLILCNIWGRSSRIVFSMMISNRPSILYWQDHISLPTLWSHPYSELDNHILKNILYSVGLLILNHHQQNPLFYTFEETEWEGALVVLDDFHRKPWVAPCPQDWLWTLVQTVAASVILTFLEWDLFESSMQIAAISFAKCVKNIHFHIFLRTHRLGSFFSQALLGIIILFSYFLETKAQLSYRE